MKAINLFLLAAIIGIELVLGIIVAPVIFYPQNLLGEGVLSTYESGVLMTQIFVKFGYILLFISAFNLLYEMINYRKYEAKFQLKFSILMAALINFILALIFVFYFTSYIVLAQSMGAEATQSAEFAAMHSASEVSMKIILFFQIILYFLSFKIAKKV